MMAKPPLMRIVHALPFKLKSTSDPEKNHGESAISRSRCASISAFLMACTCFAFSSRLASLIGLPDPDPDADADDDDDDDDDDDELNRRKYDEPLSPNPTKSDPNANGEESRTDDEHDVSTDDARDDIDRSPVLTRVTQ